MNHQKTDIPILLVDDDHELLTILARTLQLAGFNNVSTAISAREAFDILVHREFTLAVLDLNLPESSGRDILAHILERYPRTSVIFLSGANDLETAVDCMRLGASDYLLKPLAHDKFIAAVKHTIELRIIRDAVSLAEQAPSSETLEHESSFAPIITKDKEMRKLFRHLEIVAPTEQTILVTGETGVGKELFARAIHDVSGRKGEFVAVNVAGLDDMVFSDTLFGHRKGAYTGADQVRQGLVATACDGTLFLDEIGSLNEQSQTKLLRLLQEKEYYPLGADSPLKSRARIILATNKDLLSLVGQQSFRKDLYYRIAGCRVNVPPLRSRIDDLPLLLDHFITDAATALGRKKPYCPPEISVLLKDYGFPGNVRELQSMVHGAVAGCASGKLSLESFRSQMTMKAEAVVPDSPAPSEAGFVFDRFPSLREAEEELIAAALRRAGGNQGIAATMLGITRQALNNRLRRRARSG